jgi:uncharacterized protein (TIGR02271 family)
MRDTYSDISSAATGAIEQGWDVYGDDDEHLGTVEGLGENYLLIQKGLIFTKDIYVPFSAVTDAADGVVRVNVGKGELESMGWDSPPTGTGYGDSDLEGTGRGASDYGASGTTASGSGTSGYGDTSYGTTGSDIGHGATGSGATSDTTYDTSSYGATSAATAGTGVGDTQRERMTLHEEELEARTTPRQTGEVELRKEIVEDQQTIQVPVQREEVHVRRVPADRTAAVDDASFSGQGETLRVPVMEEEVEVTKRPRVREEVEVEKVTRQDTQHVTDTVRREELDVSGAADASSSYGRSTSDGDLLDEDQDRPRGRGHI